MKPTVYVESSVIGYLTAWPQKDVAVAGHQSTTKIWWSSASGRFELFVSQLVIRECSDGDSVAAAERLAAIEGIPSLPITIEAEALIEALLDGHAVPKNQPNDALHIALAAVHGVEYLISCEFSSYCERCAATGHRTYLSAGRLRTPSYMYP